MHYWETGEILEPSERYRDVTVNGRWFVEDQATGKYVRPSAADPYEMADERSAERFADLMNERSASRAEQAHASRSQI